MQATRIDEQRTQTSRSRRCADEMRPRLHRMWAAVADGWGEHAEKVDDAQRRS